MATEALMAKASMDNRSWNSSVDAMKSKTQVFARAAAVAFSGTATVVKKFSSSSLASMRAVVRGTSAATKGLSSVAKGLTSFVNGGLWKAAALATSAGVAIGAMVKSAADSGDQLAKMSDRTGMAVDFLSKLRYAAGQSGTSLDEMEVAIKKLQKAAYDASTGRLDAEKDGASKIAELRKQQSEEMLRAEQEEGRNMAKASAKSAKLIEKAESDSRKSGSRKRSDEIMSSALERANELKASAQEKAQDRLARLRESWAERLADTEKNLASKIEDGSGVAQAFKDLGVSVTDANGTMKSSERLFMDVASALSKVSDATRKAALAQQVFGKSGTSMLPFLKDGRKGMQGLFAEAQSLTYVWSESTARAAEALGDSFDRVWATAKGMSEHFAVGLFQSIQKVTDGITGWYTANKQLIDQKVEKWSGSLAGSIAAVWGSVKSFYEDKSFELWWERARLAVMGLEGALSGVGYVLDMAVAGYYRLTAAAQLAAGNEADYIRNRTTAKLYEQNAGTKFVARSKEWQDQYAQQADKVARLGMSVTKEARKNAAAQVTVNVQNQGVGNMTPRDAQKIGAALAKEVSRGRMTVGQDRAMAGQLGYTIIGG